MAGTHRGGLAVAILGLGGFAAAVIWFGIVRVPHPGAPSNAVASGTPPVAASAAPPSAAPAPAVQARAEPPRTEPAVPAQSAAPAVPKPDAASAATPSSPPAATAQPPAAETVDAKPAPSFDVVRVEPTGEAVIAGRGAPGATIDLLRDGKSHARVVADASGLFAFVPPPLPPGSHEIVLQSIAPDGTRSRSRDSVTVVIAPSGIEKPLVAMTSPDKPTVLLSSPEPPAPPKEAPRRVADAPASSPSAQMPAPTGPAPSAAADAQAGAPPTGAPKVARYEPGKTEADRKAPRPEVRVATVEAEDNGRLYVSGQAAPGATVRLYLNDTLIAPGSAGGDGKVSFAIGRGIRPGDYRVRLDDVDPVSGDVKTRAEVAFTVPPVTGPAAPVAGPAAPAAVAQAQPAQTAKPQSAPAPVPSAAVAPAPSAPAAEPKPASPAVLASTSPRVLDPNVVLVPEVNTAIVARGDNLWSISRRIYGHGMRYTVIYTANQQQIRNPDLIYPGQVFVLPAHDAPPEPAAPDPKAQARRVN